jgi:hypothetical protein
MSAPLLAIVARIEAKPGMEGRRVHGHEAVRDYWTRQWNLVDPHAG